MLVKYWKEILLGILSIIAYIAVSQLAQAYNPLLKEILLQTGSTTPIAYILITIVAIVIAPLGSTFFLPVVANVFGPWQAAVYSIIGWFIGSIIAFYLSRKFGYGHVKNIKIAQKAHCIEAELSPTRLYIVLLLLRAALPVDVLSYVLGLFTKISYKIFITTTLIGITPFAFLFAYAAVLPLWVQVVVSILSTMSLLWAIYFLITYTSSKKNKK